MMFKRVTHEGVTVRFALIRKQLFSVELDNDGDLVLLHSDRRPPTKQSLTSHVLVVYNFTSWPWRWRFGWA